MSKLIDRQALIDEIEMISFDDYGDYLKLSKVIEDLPSAEPNVPDTNVGDMISRQDAINGMKEYFHDEYYQRTSIQDCRDCFIEDILTKLPSAESERKTGKWKQISPAKIYECSRCGQNVMTNDIDSYLYCHGCGAKMEGEDDE